MKCYKYFRERQIKKKKVATYSISLMECSTLPTDSRNLINGGGGCYTHLHADHWTTLKQEFEISNLKFSYFHTFSMYRYYVSIWKYKTLAKCLSSSFERGSSFFTLNETTSKIQKKGLFSFFCFFVYRAYVFEKNAWFIDTSYAVCSCVHYTQPSNFSKKRNACNEHHAISQDIQIA